MNTNLLSVVRQIIADNGEAIFNEPARLKALFGDLAKDEPKPLRLAFGRAIEAGAYDALKTAADGAERASRKTAIAQSVLDEHGLDVTLCSEALDILETALFGTVSEAQPRYTPPPAPSYQPAPYQQPAYQQPQYQQPQYQQQPYQQAANKNPWQYFTGAFKKYAVFQGRARRAEYWSFWLFDNIFYTLLFIAGLTIGDLFFILNCLWLLAAFLPGWGVMVRRYHDVDKSAWWWLVPIYGFVLLFFSGTVGPNRFGPDPKQDPAIPFGNPQA
jgi:uncharacterized membrane protein YhaH (DUF805 family)